MGADRYGCGVTLLALLPDLHALVVDPLLLGIKWLDPQWLLGQFGETFFWVSLAIIFVECGLFFPFLPGDTLLFAMGLFISGGSIDIFPGGPLLELGVAFLLMTAAAIGGNIAGYEIGRAIGPPLYEREGRVLKRKYFDQTQAFFDLHGNKALVIGRFIPFVRTYITVVAGVTRMDRQRFIRWSFIGAVLWVASILALGYFLGQTFPTLGENIDKAILVILAFSIIPIAYEWLKHKRAAKKGTDHEVPGPTTPSDMKVEPEH